MKKTILCLGLLAAAASTQAIAQDTRWYIGAAVGQSNFSGNFTPYSVDNKDISTSIAAGYNFSKFVGLELGLLDFGKAKVTGIYQGVPFSSDAKAPSAHVSLILTAPVDDAISIYGRIGAASTDRKVVACVSGGCGTTSDRKTEVVYGIGLGYAFTKRLTGTLEYLKLNDSKISAINAGVRFGF